MQVTKPLLDPMVTPDTVILNPARSLLEYGAAKQQKVAFVAQPPGSGPCECKPAWGAWSQRNRACTCCGMEAWLGSVLVAR